MNKMIKNKNRSEAGAFGNILDKDALTVTDECFGSKIIHAMSAKRLFTKTFPSPAVQIPETATKKAAFSLVEMLMALLVASLVMAALAPVMTKRMNSNISINGDFNIPDKQAVKFEITPDKTEYCNTEIFTDTDGSEYYECKFTVPDNYNGPMQITLISAGGGGGTAPTAGYTEFTTAGSTNTFKVPAMVNKIEATLISGGAGGGAGGQKEVKKIFDDAGVSSWNNIPDVIKGKYVSVIGCGGGGGGGGASNTSTENPLPEKGGGGGSGGYRTTPIGAKIDEKATSIPYQVGGGGGGSSSGNSGYPTAGYCGGGGCGGSDKYRRVTNTCPGEESGTNNRFGGLGGGIADGAESPIYIATGGFPNGGTAPYYTGMDAADIGGGNGVNGGNGGKGGYKYAGTLYYTAMGGGGGGAYGGGGGGTGCVGPGGGGGGPTYFNDKLIASGGGGGGGSGRTQSYANKYICAGGGGGGGGGSNGGAGGNGGDTAEPKGILVSSSGNGGEGGYPNGSNGGVGSYGYNSSLATATKWGTNYCRGGNGGNSGWNTANVYTGAGEPGKSGIIEVTYLDYGPGGSGGGGGQMVPIQPVTVTPGETLRIAVGKGASGGKAGKIESNGTITSASLGYGGAPKGDAAKENVITSISKENKYLLMTDTKMLLEGVLGWSGSCGGSPTGETLGINITPFYGCRGYMSNGKNYVSRNTDYSTLINQYKNQFLIEDGHTAGNTTYIGKKTYDNGTTGGDGGKLTTPWFTCTPGKGGENPGEKGGDATGYGCGGGGGYGLSDGGSGSGGYARISWNLYWDTATKAYKRAETGSGGGGASGNIMKFSVANVIAGQTYTIRIGKGGRGAYVADNTVIPAKQGGSTVFELGISDKLKVLGGFGGLSTIVNGNTISNGNGGAVPDSKICYYNSSDYTKKPTYCIKGQEGFTSENSNGGNGGSLPGYGTGGAGGVQDTGDRSKGQKGGGNASGGGGAAIREITGSINASDILNNPNEGGPGADGKVIIQILRPAG